MGTRNWGNSGKTCNEFNPDKVNIKPQPKGKYVPLPNNPKAYIFVPDTEREHEAVNKFHRSKK